MLKILLTKILLLTLSIAIYSQTPDPTPTQTNDDEVVKISTSLIQIDVTVTDNKGNVVTDLKAEDFEIYENGKKQDISNFSFISDKSQAEKAKKNDKEDESFPNLPTKIRPNQVRRTIALVVDDLTLSFQSTYQVKRALNKFVDEQMLDGDLVAIIRTGAGIGALQQFTGDKRLLREAIKRVRWNSLGTGDIGAFAPLRAVISEPQNDGDSDENENPNDDDGVDETVNEVSAQDELNDFRRNLFATGTLGALNYIVKGMGELPGRKSVMFFSDGFELFTLDSNGFANSSILDGMKTLIDQANRASVVVYTLDARGLVTTGLSAADDTGGRSIEQIQDEISGRSDKLFDTQEGLRYLARETGGFAIINNNRLSQGVEKVLNDQSYYLIAYEPNDETFDPENLKFNKLSIKVKQDGVKVRYRSGFFGMSDEDVKKPIQNLTPRERLDSALISPFAVNDINITLNTFFKSDDKKKLYLNSFLFIDLKDLKFVDGEDGAKKSVFDILAMSFGDNGVPVDQTSKTYTVNIKGEHYQKLIDEGLVYYFGFPVKKAGAYQMRVAIRDHNTDKVGSANQFVVVPKLKKKRLTLSGVVLDNVSYDEWNTFNQKNQPSIENQQNVKVAKTNPMAATSLRRFPRGTVLRYGLEIYNSKSKNGQQPQLEVRNRVFLDGKLIFDGKPTDIDTNGLENTIRIATGGALNLGSKMQAGDYVLQIIVTDKLAKQKWQTTSEFIQFELF